MVIRGELHRDVFEVGGALRTQVHDDVQNGPPGRPHQLRLRGGRVLEMHTPQRPLPAVERDVGLGDEGFQALVGEFTLAEGAGEEPTAVLAPLDVDDERAPELRFYENHVRLPAKNSGFGAAPVAGAAHSSGGGSLNQSRSGLRRPEVISPLSWSMRR